MFNPTKISGILRGLVGFRQPFKPDLPVLDSENLTSRSGLIVNEHAMAKIEYLYDCQDYAEISDLDFNTYLKQKQDQSIIDVCSAVFKQPVFIDRQVLYKNAINKGTGLESLPDGFVGYKIVPSSTKNLAFEIKRCLLEFDGAGDIELVLFNTSQKAPLFSQVVTISSDLQEIVLDWRLDNTDSIYKGEYYFGYLTNYVDIGTVVPFKREYENAIIESCIDELWIERGGFSGMNTNELPNLEDWDGLSETTGLNPDVTVFDDYTDLIINNEFLFSKAIQLNMQIAVLEEIANSIRANRNTRIGESHLVRILQEIEGQSGDNVVKISGLRPKLYGALNSLKKEIKKLQRGYFGDGLYNETLK
jgi:hypothetical protein